MSQDRVIPAKAGIQSTISAEDITFLTGFSAKLRIAGKGSSR
jgi:hypothetical protein